MRIQRDFFKPRREPVYLHVYNHTVILDNDPYPLGEFEKSKFIEIAERYLTKYNIEIISLVLMDNHFHALLHCSHKEFDQEQACKAFNKFHNRKRPVDKDDYRVKSLVKHSNNFSEYMREIQREFTRWFNKNRPYKRKGALWQDRFQCQLIESDVYLWGCLKYIEMNPVRAKICQKPEEYQYSSYGRWQEKHPYQESFLKHIVSLSEKKSTIKDFKQYMKKQMQVMHARDQVDHLRSEGRGLVANRLWEKVEKETADSEILIITFAKEDWVSGKVIGSKEFERRKYREWLMYRNTA